MNYFSGDHRFRVRREQIPDINFFMDHFTQEVHSRVRRKIAFEILLLFLGIILGGLTAELQLTTAATARYLTDAGGAAETITQPTNRKIFLTDTVQQHGARGI